jgi:AraC family transcriptional regulator
MSAKNEARPPVARSIAAGRGWSVSEFVCDAGPDDRPFEERHDRTTIAAVLSGAFKYRTRAGEHLVHPGAFVLGAAGCYYECGHEHGRGDRCLSFSFDADFFDEIAHAASGAAGYSFDRAALPSSPALLPLAARVAALRTNDALALEDMAARVAFAVVNAASGHRAKVGSPSALDEKRVAAAMRYIEDNAAEDVDLDQLADVAGVSKFHFLRIFTRIAGSSPYRFLLDARLRRAATEIARCERRISEIAYDCGFGDLSTFNARFRATFGMSPRAWRGAGR